MKTRWMIPMMGLLATGCGGSDGSGLTVNGLVAVTVHQSGQPDGTTGFNLSAGTVVDAPPGRGTGFNGTCVRAGSQWTVSLARSDNVVEGLRSLVVTVPASGDAGATDTHLALTVGTSSFSAGGRCVGTATPLGASDLRLAVQCTGLQASGDPRTVDGSVTLTITNCTGS